MAANQGSLETQAEVIRDESIAQANTALRVGTYMRELMTLIDVVNDLTTGGATKYLSAEQGVALKALIDAITSDYMPKTGGDFTGDITVAGTGTFNSGTGDTVALFTSSDSTARILIQDNNTSCWLVSNNDILSIGHTNVTSALNLNVNNLGNVMLGSITDSGEKLQVTGTGKFSGAVSGADGVEDDEFVTVQQAILRQTPTALTDSASVTIDCLNKPDKIFSWASGNASTSLAITNLDDGDSFEIRNLKIGSAAVYTYTITMTGMTVKVAGNDPSTNSLVIDNETIDNEYNVIISRGGTVLSVFVSEVL